MAVNYVYQNILTFSKFESEKSNEELQEPKKVTVHMTGPKNMLSSSCKPYPSTPGVSTELIACSSAIAGCSHFFIQPMTIIQTGNRKDCDLEKWK